jgi:bidirectional [NiFe] hydrogenase diaphorase subunit
MESRISASRPEAIISIDDLRALSQQEQEKAEQYKHKVFVCMGTACQANQSAGVLSALNEEVSRRGMKDCLVAPGGCQGTCARAPMVSVQPQDVLYSQVAPEDAAQLIDSLDKEAVEKLRCDTSAPFFTKQMRIVTELRGLLNPEHIEDYIAAGGYEALFKALTEMSPSDVLHQVSKSGLRGRGGAGYPTGLKWSTVSKAAGKQKYVIVNADEGDPGAFMNRSILEDYPFRVLEGLTIAAYAVGADKGYVYVRAEYPLAVTRMQAAIRNAQRWGLLGDKIAGTSFNFNVEIRLGAGAFVCGEETALIASIEGNRGVPRPRPPYPAESGLWGCPTLINNVETYTNIVPIISRGGQWYAAIGTEHSKGTKTFALTGKVLNSGLIEVPLGTTLREVIFDIGGGVPTGQEFKAVQTGGPAGGCLPAKYLDTPLDYEALQKLGSFMGSGGLIVMDTGSCIVDVAKFFMQFCATESCGKCVPCRVGTVHIHDILEKISRAEATMADITMLEDLCDVVKNTSLCGLGMGAPNPVLSMLNYFREECLEHVTAKKCPAGVCPMGVLEGAQCVL